MSIQAILYQKGEHVETIAPDASVKDAAASLKDQNIAALVVTTGDDVLGIVSEREIVHALSRHGERSAAMKVADVLVRDFATVAPEDSLKRAMILMTRHRTRHLPVLRDDKLVGIVSIGDVVKHRLEDLELGTNVLRDAYTAAVH
jgi:CBS domain-containing protein